jgi:hypothetical protein
VSWRQLQDIRQWQTQVFTETHRRTLVANPLESVVNGLAALARGVNSDPGQSLMLSATLPRAIDNNLAVGRTPISTGQGRVWSLVELRNGELVSGGDDGSLRRWRNDKPVGGPLQTGQGRVLSLIELRNGELISGGHDGTLVWLSADRVIQNACRHELPELMRAPERLSDMKARDLCQRTGALR